MTGKTLKNVLNISRPFANKKRATDNQSLS